MKDINDYRNEIDKIDSELVSLYLKRMQAAKEIGVLKGQTGLSVHDKSREKEIVYRLAGLVPDDMKRYIKELYDVVFSTSRAYQSRYSNVTSPIVEEIKKISQSELLEFPVAASVACQGVEGANSEVAAEKVFHISNITYFKNFDGVFTAVEKGFCEYGILPIENSTAGSVSEVYDLMKKHNFYVAKTVKVKIDHCLCGVKGAKISDIKTVVSHKQAILQCSEYLKTLKTDVEISDNTAIAAKRLAESGDKNVGVICNARCAELYGLSILSPSIQDSNKNYTRFICISKNLNVFKGSDKISVMVSLDHTPGSLNKMLSKFNALGLNLTKIESRPIANSDFEFMFYFDFEGDVTDKNVLNLLAELQNGSEEFVFLGAYKEIN